MGRAANSHSFSLIPYCFFVNYRDSKQSTKRPSSKPFTSHNTKSGGAVPKTKSPQHHPSTAAASMPSSMPAFDDDDDEPMDAFLPTQTTTSQQQQLNTKKPAEQPPSKGQLSMPQQVLNDDLQLSSDSDDSSDGDL